MDYYTIIHYFEDKLGSSNAHWDLEIEKETTKTEFKAFTVKK
jgi:hypothetical protein